eukprot:2169340-Rhodomonas_salina.3
MEGWEGDRGRREQHWTACRREAWSISTRTTGLTLPSSPLPHHNLLHSTARLFILSRHALLCHQILSRPQSAAFSPSSRRISLSAFGKHSAELAASSLVEQNSKGGFKASRKAGRRREGEVERGRLRTSSLCNARY